MNITSKILVSTHTDPFNHFNKLSINYLSELLIGFIPKSDLTLYDVNCLIDDYTNNNCAILKIQNENNGVLTSFEYETGIFKCNILVPMLNNKNYYLTSKPYECFRNKCSDIINWYANSHLKFDDDKYIIKSVLRSNSTAIKKVADMKIKSYIYEGEIF